MKEFKMSSGKKLELYETAKEMPILRWNRFLSYMIQDSDLGPSFESLSHKISLAIDMVKEQKMEDFSTLMRNLQLQMYYCFKGISPKIHALGQRIKSVDGQVIQEVSPELLEEIKNDPSLTVELMEGLTEDFRKK